MKKIIPLILCILFTHAGFGQLNGIYTIGGASPNYATITLAVNDLIAQGVNGPVTFNIRNGTYTERIILPAISGASSANIITFQSENLDSAAVIWQNNSNQISQNYVLQLDGANYIHIRYLSMYRHLSAANGCRILVLQNGASNNFFEHIHFRGKSLTSSTNHELIYSANTLDTANTYSYNKFNGGYYSAFLQGTSATVTENSNYFFNNVFATVLIGIYYTNASQVRIENNSITATNGPLNIVNGKQNASIINNNTSAAGGISITGFASTSGDSVHISGNMIRATGGSGIYLSQCPYSYLFHNSIKGATTNSSGTLHAVSSYVRGYNNIFQNTSSGYAMYFNSTSVNTDYNILYTGNSTLVRYGTNNYSSITAWRAALSQDIHSYQNLPGFISTTNLHIFSDIQASNHAYNINVATDLDGDVRSATPDIGADEFNQPDNNAGVIAVSNIPLRTCAGNTPVEVNLRNFGEQNLNSAVIKWQVNGINQTPYSWTGNLNSGDTVFSVQIGNYNILQNQNYTIKVWADSPNGITDSVAADDTISYGLIKTRMSGIYTIGGITPDFATFNLGLADLNNRGVCGPVVFNVRDGMYNEALVLNGITGASSVNTITFQSESLDSSKVFLYQTESNSSSNWIIQTPSSGLAPGHYNFRHLTIMRTDDPSGSRYHLIRLTGSYNMQFTHCNFRGYDPYAGTAIELFTATNFLLDRCKFYRMSKGLSLTSTMPNNKNITITNNSFENLSAGNMEISYILDSLLIKSNTFKNDTILLIDAMNQGALAIAMGTCYGTVEVEHNIIRGRFHRGMELTALFGTSTKHIRVNNNFICVGSASYNGTIAVHVQQNTYLDFEHNSIRTYNTPWSAMGKMVKASVYYSLLGGGTNMIFRNNCIQADSGQYVYEFGSQWNTIFDQLDYNNVYITFPLFTQMTNSILGWPGSFNQHSLTINPQYVSREDLHVANAGLKAGLIGSVLIDIDSTPRVIPPTIGADEIDNYNNNAGSVLTYTQQSCDSTDIYTHIVNYGTDTLISTLLHIYVNGVPLDTISWTGLLLPGDTSVPILTGTILNQFDSTYVIAINTNNPNSSGDLFPANDTSYINFLLPFQSLQLNSDLTVCPYDSVYITPSDTSYLSQFQWSNGDSTAGIFASLSGTYFVSAINSYGCTVSDTIAIIQITLTQPHLNSVADSIFTNVPGNGNNQWYFNGSSVSGATNDYYLAPATGNYYLLYTDSNGCSIYSDTLYVVSTGAKHQHSNNLMLFPNPADESLNIRCNYSQQFNISVYNSAGAIVLVQQSKNTGQIFVQTDKLPAGIYFIKIDTEYQNTLWKKFIVQHSHEN